MAYRDKEAVTVLSFIFSADNFTQTLHVVHSHDANVVIEAERLDKSEVDLERDVAFELLVHGQDAERHAVRITAEIKKENSISLYSLRVEYKG